jgi:Holliday junction resolvase RusA-like endonuclease
MFPIKVRRINFVIPGQPVPKGRPRFGRGHAYTPKKTKEAEEVIKWSFFGATGNSWKPLKEYAELRVSFFIRGYRRADLDNLIKLVADSLNGMAWTDDRIVREIHGVAHDQAKVAHTIIEVSGE